MSSSERQSAWEIRLLGRPEVHAAGRRVEEFSTHKAWALFSYLTLNPGPQSRSRLAGLLWGEDPERNARRSLRVALSNLRDLVGPLIEADRKSIAYSEAADAFIDVRAFRQWADGAGEARADDLARAVQLYRGDLLQGIEVSGAAAFQEWLLLEREALRQRMIEAAHGLAAAKRRGGHLDEAVQLLRKLAGLNPLEEAAHRELMHTLALQGKYSLALAQYKRCESILSRELQVEPSRRTRKLQARILSLRDRPRRSVPQPPTPFFGREDVIELLQRELRDPHHRLVTLTGPGGVGKTRLALEASHRAPRAYLDGVVFIRLEGLANTDGLVAEVSSQMARSGMIEPPQGGMENPERLARQLEGLELLIVLDGYEQLLPNVDPLLIWLRSLKNVDFLVTSRRRLDLRWERVIPLRGLRVPPRDAGDAGWERYPAIELFLDSARRVDPGFEPDREAREAISEFSRFAEGLPLALELAGASLRGRKVHSLLDWMASDLDGGAPGPTDLPPRQRSLSALLDHSWQLLTPKEREVLRRLSVIQSPFDSEAAEAVAGADARTLQQLAEHSLLRRTEGETAEADRYELHQIVRQFAAEKLRHADEGDQIRERHSRHYLGRAAQAADGEAGNARTERMRGLAWDLSDVAAAWRWAVQAGETDGLQPVLVPLFELCRAAGRFDQGRRLLREALDQLGSDPADIELQMLKARLRLREARFIALLGQMDQPTGELAGELEQLAGQGWPEDEAFGHKMLGNLHYVRGEYGRARSHYHRLLELATERELPYLFPASLLNLANVSFALGEERLSRTLSIYGTRQFLRQGGDHNLALALTSYSYFWLVLGHLSAAAYYARRARQRAGERAPALVEAFLLGNETRLLLAEGRIEAADKRVAACRRMAEEVGLDRIAIEAELLAAKVAAASGELAAARRGLRNAAEGASERRISFLLLEALVTLAGVVAAAQPQLAKRLAQAVSEHPSVQPHTIRQAEEVLLGVHEDEGEAVFPVSVSTDERSLPGASPPAEVFDGRWRLADGWMEPRDRIGADKRPGTP